MKDQIRQKQQLFHLGRLCRRTVAMILALAMVLPTTVAFGAGGPAFVPTEPDGVTPHPLEAGEEPTITIEANAVVNRWYDKGMGDPSDYLTGDLEVAIRVKSGQLADGTWQPFNTLGVALDYSPILTPYSWTLIDGIDLSGEDLSALTPEERVKYKTDAAQPVKLANTVQFEEMTSMQTLKSKQITAAVAHVSGQMEKDAEGKVTAVKDGHLYMMAQADRPVVLEKDTVLAVVTFKYDVENIKILASEAADWFQWLVGPGASTAAEGDEGDGATGDGTGTIGGVAPEDQWLVRLTTIEDTNESYYGGREVRYDSEDNSMYHSSTRQPLPAGLDTTVVPPVQTYVDNYIELNKDVTQKVEHQVNFTLVNQTTYNDGGLTLDDLATVLFYDWDDTLLGLVIVPKDGDARKLVNDYVSSHFIHPQIAGAPNYTSLARIDNYRGKYPATAPMAENAPDDGTVDPNGGEYALTNKLDYVFFKRPMEQVMQEVDGEQVPTGEWKQKTKTGADGEEGDWDTQYPYLYGWAIVPDYRHPENIWTTLGMGELNSYSGSAGGGYQDIGTAPATVIPTDTKFEFADFDFRAKNDNSLKAGSIYAVKAVYEPGVDLLGNDFYYRMTSSPYYNKLNAAGASAGGAYSIDVTFERASLQMNNVVRGVARMRDPYVRQDTTTDLKWEVVSEEDEREDLKVNHNLPNAVNTEAYTDKNKTTYTKINIDNVEEISFSLTLSARQNKVDYYFIEAYGANFVSGVPRIQGDALRSAVEATIDNYNYFVESSRAENSSDETDEWYDASYDERSGSHGFVLDGTLNQLMQLATQCNAGEITRQGFAQYATMAVLGDVNICFADGSSPTVLNVSELVTKILAAADAAKPSNNGGSTQYWDTEHNCAKLTYHQLQGYIIDNSLAHDEKPIYRSDGKVALTWCHLHSECVAKTSGKPRNWKELIETAQGTDDPEGKIALLTLAEIERLFHLRADANGTQFISAEDFASVVVTAVRAGNTTWDTVQDYIIRRRSDSAYAQENYWWYDGSTSVPLNSWSDLLDTTKDIFEDVTLPDGVTGRRQAKLNQLRTAFTANAALPGDEAATTWIWATENLCLTDEAGKFTSFDEFKKEFIAALTALGRDAAWNEVQYYILHKTDPSSDPNAETEYGTYYWRNGGRKVTDVSSMLSAAQKAVNGDVVSWEAFTYSDLYTYPGLQFRKDFAGTIYLAGEFDDFKKEILTLVGQGTNRSWEQVQYYLIHSAISSSGVISNEAQYYWWKDGNEGKSVDFSGVSDYNTGLIAFLEATFLYEINGNTHAWDDLTTDIVKAARLITNNNGATTFDGLGHFSDVASFRTAISGFAVAAGAMAPSGSQALVKPNETTITWQQMQYYLLNSKSFVDAGTAGAENYWWRTQDDLGNVKGPEEYFAELLIALQDVFDNGDTTAVDAWLRNVDQLNAVFLNWEGPFTQDDADGYADTGYDLWGEMVESGAFGSASEVSWYQIQYLLLNWCYSWMTDDEVADDFMNNGITVPDWVPEPVSMFAMMLRSSADSISAQIMALTERINSLTAQLQADPSKIEKYSEEINELLAAVDALKALLSTEPEEVLPPVEPTESPVPTESVTPSPSESAGADVPVDPETSPEPTESAEPDISESPAPSPEPSETPGTGDSIDPTPTPEPLESPGEFPDPEPPKEDKPSQETPDQEKENSNKDIDPASPSGGGGAGEAGDGEGQEMEKSPNEVDLTIDPPTNLSTTALTRSPPLQYGNRISLRLLSPAPGGGRLRRPTLPKFMTPSQWTVSKLILDRATILTIGRTQA